MPYARNSELPEAVKALPAGGQTIYRKAFNSAFDQYNDEAKAHATAWTAVKAKYHKVGDKWVAKEAEMITKEATLSADDKRRIIQSALDERYPYDQQAYSHTPSPWVRDVYDDNVVYDMGGSCFRVGYTMTEEGKVTLGDDTKKVFAQTVYSAIESLRQKFAELVREAGERGVLVDADLSKSCTTVMEAESPDDDAIQDAISDIGNAIEQVRLQEATKTEDGVSYPSNAFAYVPDADKPSTWKLRLWEDLEKKETPEQVGRAAAALSPGGYRGQRVQIVESALAGVKATIRAAYRKLGIKPEDMSKWVTEVQMRERVAEACEIDIKEVTKEGIAKGIVPVRILMPGFNYGESRYYSEKAVRDAVEIFDGAKMFSDHATAAEEEAMPERSIQDWVATLHETKVSESGNAVGVAHINAGWLKEKIANLFELGDLQHLGTSINCLGQGTKQTIEGKKTMLIEGLSKGTFGSVDFVTEAGAGGQAGLRESAQDNVLDAELIDVAQLREARPDLVAIIETATKEAIQEEVREAMEATKELEDLKAQVETLTTENGELKTTIEEAEKAKVKAEAQATIKEAIDKAELPEAAKTKLVEKFADATDADGIEDAIKEEAAYIATIKGDGKVKGLGDTSVPTEEARKSAEESLRESTRQANPDWSDEQIEYFIAGRR